MKKARHPAHPVSLKLSNSSIFAWLAHTEGKRQKLPEDSSIAQKCWRQQLGSALACVTEGIDGIRWRTQLLWSLTSHPLKLQPWISFPGLVCTKATLLQKQGSHKEGLEQESYTGTSLGLILFGIWEMMFHFGTSFSNWNSWTSVSVWMSEKCRSETFP